MTAFASDACFQNPKIQGLINASKELDSCFVDISSDPCGLKLLTIEEQRDVNSQRLVPLNRIEQPFFNDAVGIISTDVHEKTPVATAQRVSSCHLITSAHLFYKDGSVPVSPQEVPVPSDHVSAYFHFGQTCSAVRTRESTSARVIFKMTREGIDFVCDGKDSSGICVRRHFYGKSDIVILRVEDGGRSNNYFDIAPSVALNPRQGANVNCWGFPSHNQYLNLDKNLSNMLLWHQKKCSNILWGERARAHNQRNSSPRYVGRRLRTSKYTEKTYWSICRQE
jgi:hypothetical protein